MFVSHVETIKMLLADMNWSQLLLALVIVGVCFFLVVVILLQRGRGGGLAGAFGGGGGSGTFGAKTGDVFTWITVAFAGVFLLLAIFANFVFDRSEFALANPATVQPTPTGEGGGPAAPAQDAGPQSPKVELITDDGQVVPANVDFKVVPPTGSEPGRPAEQPPSSPPPANPGTATPPPANGPASPPSGAPVPPGDAGQANDKAPEQPKEPGR